MSRLGALFLAVLALGLADPALGGVKGKVRKGEYLSPAANFVVPVPSGARISDWFSKREPITGAVSFHTDMGSNLGIFYMDVAPAGATLSFPSDSVEFRSLETWLRDVAMVTWFQRYAGSALLKVVPGTFAGMTAAISLVDLPGGSQLVNIQGRHLDSRRGLVVFNREHYVYMLSVETRTLFDLAHEAASDSVSMALGFLPQLDKFYQTIEFAR